MDTNQSNRAVVDIEMGSVTEAASYDPDLFASWVVDIEARAGNMDMVSQQEALWQKASIYKVPNYKRELNPKAFTPLLVSFGPFHHHNPELKKMEVHKEITLVQFLKRTNQSLQSIIHEVAKIIAELRDAYYCLDHRWKTNDEEFLKMMILDGCFMLQILQMIDELIEDNFNESVYYNLDPYFGVHAAKHKWSYIRRDMLLIENQLPLLLLKTLLQFQTPTDHEDINLYINRLVLNLVAENRYTTRSTTMGLHALDLFRHNLLGSEPQSHDSHQSPFDLKRTQSEPSQTQFELQFKALHTQLEAPQTQFELSQTQFKPSQTQSEPLQTQPEPLQDPLGNPQTEPISLQTMQNQLELSRKQWEQLREQLQTQEISIIRCAVELNEIGVKFRKSKTNSLKEIKFKSGKFHLPVLEVDDATECSLLNVITFEYLHASLDPDVTIYVALMDEIIDSANDVSLLRKKGLILNTLGSDEEVSSMFKSMGKEINIHYDDHLCKVKKGISKYCRKRRHRWRFYLKKTGTFLTGVGILLIVCSSLPI